MRQTVCVVFDVLRATSTMVTALGNGAAAILPVAEIPEALSIRQRQPEILLAGERDGVRIEGQLDGRHQLRPGQFPARVHRGQGQGKDHRHDHDQRHASAAGLRAGFGCAAGFVSEPARHGAVHREPGPAHLLLVCSGTLDQAAYEDLLGAGALCDLRLAQVQRRRRGGFRALCPPPLSPRTERSAGRRLAVPQWPPPDGPPGFAGGCSLLPPARPFRLGRRIGQGRRSQNSSPRPTPRPGCRGSP